MRLPHFQYVAPKTIEEACSLLAAHPGESYVLAGGTDLLVKMKQRRVVPGYVLNIKGIPGMDRIDYDEKTGLRIGALVTIQSLKNSVTVKRHCKILAEAAAAESSVQIRNVATLGGNIANASPAADAPLALLALGASIVLTRTDSQRIVPIEEFFIGPGKTTMEPGEIITEIRILPLPPKTGVAYLKHAVRRTDIAIVSAAVVLTLKEDVCAEVRIALGSVAPTAIRARKAESLIRGKNITEELAESAGRAAVEESRPIDDIRGYAEYRAKTVFDITKQGILQAVQDARLGGI